MIRVRKILLSAIIFHLLIAHLTESESTHNLINRGGDQQQCLKSIGFSKRPTNQIPPPPPPDIFKDDSEPLATFGTRSVSSPSTRSETLNLQDTFSDANFIHSTDIDYGKKAAALLQKSTIPPPPPGLLPRSTRLEVLVRSVNSYDENAAWRRDLFNRKDTLICSSQWSRNIAAIKHEAIENILSHQKPSETTQDSNDVFEKKELIGDKKRVDNVLQLETGNMSLTEERIDTTTMRVTSNLVEHLNHESLEAYGDKKQEIRIETDSRMIMLGSKEEPLNSKSENNGKAPDCILIDLPQASKLAIQTLHPILTIKPRTKRRKRKITKTRSVPRRSILSSLADDSDRDLDDEEFALLIEDLKQSIMVEDTYDIYEYDELNPYTISQEPLSFPFRNICNPGAAVYADEDDSEEVFEENYGTFLHSSAPPDSWEYPNFD